MIKCVFQGLYIILEHFCDNRPCQNGGKCYPSKVKEYRCDCALGYSGETCIGKEMD